MRWTYPLAELDASAVSLAGGKGASLGELVRAGVPVPPGFVVASDAFRAFMQAADPDGSVAAIIRRLDTGEIEATAGAEQVLAQLAGAAVPFEVERAVVEAAAALGATRVSVRSSATCEDSGASAWAGQLETYLDVRPGQIVERMRDCWLSLFRPAALAYGAAHGYGAGQVAVGVVVQQMVESEVSGIGFSVHPVTQEPGVMLIEACLGLGEAIVSGKIVPDQFIVERGSDRILDRAIGPQTKGLFMESDSPQAEWRNVEQRGGEQKLPDEEILEYAKLLAGIEDHYGHPVDTEWARSGGRFHVLQARPITTLAAEYKQKLIDQSEAWKFLVRRPMSLVEASIWAHWIDSQHAADTLGIVADRALSIQDETGLANDFLAERDVAAGMAYVAELFGNQRQRVIDTLLRGEEITRQSKARLQAGAGAFDNFVEAADYFAEAAQYTTVFPAWMLIAYEEHAWDDAEVRALAESLRSRTLYPSIEREIIDPMAAQAAAAVGFSEPEHAPAVTTWSELRRGVLDRDLLEYRLEQVRAGRRFLFQSLDGDDDVRFVSQSGYLLMRLRQQRKLVHGQQPDTITGQAAWPGIYRGRARLVLTPDAIGHAFEDGEVLVSIQSSPELMPLLRRSGAIVTDDGGIACHAAIIARELRKPTLIGTRQATTLIRTGDLVEVDTYAQQVRILERAK